MKSLCVRTVPNAQDIEIFLPARVELAKPPNISSQRYVSRT